MKKLVMIRLRLFSKPFDLQHDIMYNEYPGLYTFTIEVPGIFIEKINRRVHLNDGTSGEMDSSFLADPDGKLLKQRAAVCLEHQ